MQKKLNLKLSDKRNFYNGDFKKPYYLYVEWGNRNFYFSNKRKAERWLKKFAKESTELHRELTLMVVDLLKINCVLNHLLNNKTSLNFKEDVFYHTGRYSELLRYTTISVEIGRELKPLLNTLLNQLAYYRKITRKNNRYNYLYEEIRFKIKQTRRLQNDFKILLSGADGICEIATDKINFIDYENKITVVA